MPEHDDSVDDKTIADGAELWRRIPKWHVIYDDNLKRWCGSTAAFEDSPNGDPMSVYLASECLEPSAALAGHDGFGLVAFSAGLARELGFKLVREADTITFIPGHVIVVGKKTRAKRKRLKSAATWIVFPLNHSS